MAFLTWSAQFILLSNNIPSRFIVLLLVISVPSKFDCTGDCYTADIRAVSVNDGSALILFGGRRPYSGQGTRAIWKYSLKNKEWSNIGNMTTDRWSHAVFPVYGIDCN